MLVQADASDTQTHGAGGGGRSRRTDFWEMQRMLPADVIDFTVVNDDFWGRIARRVVGYPVALALVAFARRRRYRVFWCLSEVDGLVLAVLFRLVRFRRPILVIGIEAASPKATFFLRRLGAARSIAALLTTSTPQTEHLIHRLGLSPSRVQVLPYQVDTSFFSPERATPPVRPPYIFAAGLESRDYDTLVAATRTLDIDIVIAAASHWAGRPGRFRLEYAPARVEVTSVGYEALRDLYAGARLVVVPLHETEYQHGVTSIQEAMAMAKPVVATRALGQGDVLADRRRALRSMPARSAAGTFARLFAPEEPELHGPTGFYVAPGDQEDLRRAIAYLLDHPELAEEMGRRGRSVAERVVSLDRFVARAGRLTRAAEAGQPLSEALLPDPPS